MESLLEEKERLTKRLQHINVNSPGRDLIIQRLKVIEQELINTVHKAI